MIVGAGGDVHVAVTVLGAAGADPEPLSAALPGWMDADQLDATAIGAGFTHSNMIAATPNARETSFSLPTVAACSPAGPSQLVHESVAGLVVAALAPPVAVTPVRAGMEK